MKKIINGIQYDTDKANLIGEVESRKGKSDIRYWYESLYKTPRRGRYFIVGKGGPMTKWARHLGTQTYGYGESIVPLSDRSAFEWAEENLDVGEVEIYFGNLMQDA